MPFAQAAIEEHGERYIIVMDSAHTIKDTLERFRTSGYPDDATWVVVTQAGGQYGVIRLPKLQRMLWDIGEKGLAQPLSAFDIPPASLVIPQDTQDYGTGELLERVASEPGFTLIITNADGLAGLITNPTMGTPGGQAQSEEILKWEKVCKVCSSPTYKPKTKVNDFCFCEFCGKKYFYPMSK